VSRLRRMSRMLILAALTAGLLLVLGGVALADAEVTIGDDGLDPETVEVDVREPIVWTNATDGDVSLVGEDPDWESGAIEPGATFSIEITRPGTYGYGTEDGSMTGEIVVAEAQGEDDADTAGADDEGTGDDEGTEVDEQVDPDEDEGEQLPHTGLDLDASTGLTAALSTLLVGFGVTLLRLTESRRRAS
jgi:plastocyanin